jgi:hypothetical protein
MQRLAPVRVLLNAQSRDRRSVRGRQLLRLLLQRHPRDQVGGALLEGEVGVLIGVGGSRWGRARCHGDGGHGGDEQYAQGGRHRLAVTVGRPERSVVVDFVPRRIAFSQKRTGTHFFLLKSFVWSE